MLSCGSVSEKMIVPPARSPYPPERVALSFSVVPTTLSGDAEASVTIFGVALIVVTDSPVPSSWTSKFRPLPVYSACQVYWPTSVAVTGVA